MTVLVKTELSSEKFRELETIRKAQGKSRYEFVKEAVLTKIQMEKEINHVRPLTPSKRNA